MDYCFERPKFCLEWWGVNQQGEDPEIKDENYACDDMRHIRHAAYHSAYGGFPDEVSETETGKIRPDILEEIVKQGVIEDIKSIKEEPLPHIKNKEQLSLFM